MVNLGTLRTSFAHVCICIYRLILPDLILVSLMKQLELSVNALSPPPPQWDFSHRVTSTITLGFHDNLLVPIYTLGRRKTL